MLPRTLTSFLSAVNEILAGPLFDAEDKGSVAYTDKLIGDGIMNIFTDPETALKTAIHIRKQLQLFNDNPRAFFPEASENMKINVGTGLAYGPVTFGIMGHSRRIDYTPIGDTVNLASRLETLTKEYHASIIINDQLYGALPDKSPFNLRHIDRIRVKGKSIPVDIYEEFSSNSPVVRDLKHAFRSRFAELQDMYFSGNEWDSAIRLAKNLMAHYKKVAVQYNIDPESPPDHLPGIYLKRMKTIRANPGLMERWDGVYTFTQK
jgi:class 3 adenylate cyclase